MAPPPWRPFPVFHVPGVACRNGVDRRPHESLTMRKHTVPAVRSYVNLAWTDEHACCHCPETTEPVLLWMSMPSRPIALIRAAMQ